MYANWKIWFKDRDGDDIRTSTDTLWKEWLLKHTIIRYFLHPDADCKRTPSGTEYLGLTNTTSDGNKCLPWVNMPNTILPYGSHESNINYCRTARQPGDHRPGDQPLFNKAHITLSGARWSSGLSYVLDFVGVLAGPTSTLIRVADVGFSNGRCINEETSSPPGQDAGTVML